MTCFATVLTYWCSGKWRNEERTDMKASGKFNYQKIACIDGAVHWVPRSQRIVVTFMLATMICQLCHSSVQHFGGSSADYVDLLGLNNCQKSVECFCVWENDGRKFRNIQASNLLTSCQRSVFPSFNCTFIIYVGLHSTMNWNFKQQSCRILWHFHYFYLLRQSVIFNRSIFVSWRKTINSLKTSNFKQQSCRILWHFHYFYLLRQSVIFNRSIFVSWRKTINSLKTSNFKQQSCRILWHFHYFYLLRQSVIFNRSNKL